MRTYTPLSAVIPRRHWPSALFASDNGTFLDRLASLHYEERGTEESFGLYVLARVMATAEIDLAFLPGLSFVLGKGDGAETGLIEAEFFAEFYRIFQR